MARKPSELANHLSDDEDDRSEDEKPSLDREVTPEQIRLFRRHLCARECIKDQDLGALATAVKLICHLKIAPLERELKNWCNLAHQLAQPVISVWVFSDFVKENKISSKAHVNAQKTIDRLQAILDERKKREKLMKRREIFKRLQASGRKMTRTLLMAEFERVESGEAE